MFQLAAAALNLRRLQRLLRKLVVHRELVCLPGENSPGRQNRGVIGAGKNSSR